MGQSSNPVSGGESKLIIISRGFLDRSYELLCAQSCALRNVNSCDFIFCGSLPSKQETMKQYSGLMLGRRRLLFAGRRPTCLQWGPLAFPEVHCSEGPLFRRSDAPKVCCSEGPLFRRFIVPKVRYSEIKVHCSENKVQYSE